MAWIKTIPLSQADPALLNAFEGSRVEYAPYSPFPTESRTSSPRTR